VHAERLVHQLIPFNDRQRWAIELVRQLIWWSYADLKAYQRDPCRQRAAQLRARFERIFRRRTGFVTLDRLLARLHARKDELLLVLDRPEIPLHTNGSENDIRCHVTKRKVSGGTWSEAGRDARDACLGLLKTCQKQGLTFFDTSAPGSAFPELPSSRRSPTWSAPALPLTARPSAPVTSSRSADPTQVAPGRRHTPSGHLRQHPEPTSKFQPAHHRPQTRARASGFRRAPDGHGSRTARCPSISRAFI
jgi:hypothetical protein